MTIAMIKSLLDACYQAKRIRDLLPPLPKGVAPAYIHYLDVIDQLERQGVRVRVSDIGDTLDIPRPGVTRTVKEMEAKGYLRKTASEEDGRVTYITATEAGKLLSQRALFFPARAAARRYFGRGRGVHRPHHREDALRDEREEGTHR